ncbi:TRAP transporter small permease [Breoghania sp. L-A4]|uniref:TRAP transporter small permease subunit n=1 Tax=Breoghania sp. L-A4 TaxID=2304600 RepID=UPI0013C358A6|nr:TRAP transporter small permease [Breoghania sp. L-A4]
MSSFDQLWRGYGTVLRICGLAAGYITFAMMVLVVANAVSRFLFNAPVSGAFEITESMLTVLIFLSLALTQYEGGHIRVVLITQRLAPPLRRAARLFALIAGALFFGWCAVAAWGYAMQSLAINEQQWGAVRYPLYPVKFVVFAGLGLLAVQFALGAVREALGRAGDEEVTE